MAQRIKLLEAERHTVALEASDASARVRILRARLQTVRGLRLGSDGLGTGTELLASEAAGATAQRVEAMSVELRAAEDTHNKVETEVTALQEAVAQMRAHNSSLREGLRAAGASSPEAAAVGQLEARLAEAGKALYAMRRDTREAQAAADASVAAADESAVETVALLRSRDQAQLAASHAQDSAAADSSALETHAAAAARLLLAGTGTVRSDAGSSSSSSGADAAADSPLLFSPLASHAGAAMIHEGVRHTLGVLSALALARAPLAVIVQQGLARHAHQLASSSPGLLQRPDSALAVDATADAMALLPESLLVPERKAVPATGASAHAGEPPSRESAPPAQRPCSQWSGGSDGHRAQPPSRPLSPSHSVLSSSSLTTTRIGAPSQRCALPASARPSPGSRPVAPAISSPLGSPQAASELNADSGSPRVKAPPRRPIRGSTAAASRASAAETAEPADSLDLAVAGRGCSR